MLRPGTIITHYLRKKHIKPSNGCSCYPLAADMDRAGADSIEEDIEEWTDKMVESIKLWRKKQDNAWAKFVCPPRFVVKNLILWACKESRKSEEVLVNG